MGTGGSGRRGSIGRVGRIDRKARAMCAGGGADTEAGPAVQPVLLGMVGGNGGRLAMAAERAVRTLRAGGAGRRHQRANVRRLQTRRVCRVGWAGMVGGCACRLKVMGAAVGREARSGSPGVNAEGVSVVLVCVFVNGGWGRQQSR